MVTGRKVIPVMLFLAVGSVTAQHVIDLSKLKLNLPAMGVVVDSVVTAFPDDQPVGEVITGAYDHRKPVHFLRPVDEALLDLFHRSLPSDSVRVRTIIKVNAIRAEERNLKGSDLALCSVHLEFLTQDASGVHRVYDHGSSRTERAAQASRLDGLLLEAIEECFVGFWSAVVNGRLRSDPATTSAIPTTVAMLDLPIMRAQHPARGIYRNFQDLRYNDPDTSIAFETTDLSKAGDPHRRVKLRALGTDDVNTAWGFSDGQHCYMNIGSSYVQLERENDLFTTYLWTSDPMDAGMLMDAAMTAPMTNQFPVYGWVQMEQKFIVDPLSGRLTLYPGQDNDPTEKETPRSRHVFGYSKFSALDTTVCLYVYGGLEACLKERQHYDFRPVRRKEFMTVELRISDGLPVKIDLDTNSPLEQFYLIKVDRNGDISVDHVNDQMAVDLLNGLDQGLEVKHQ